MKKTNILIKAIGMMVIFSLCLPMTACGKNNNQEARDSEVSVSAETEMSEVANVSDESADLSAETEEATTSTAAGMYTYTIYEGTENEMQLSMDVNIDDYINDDGFFSVGYMAEDCGWINHDGGDYYTYDCNNGTQMVFRPAYNYSETTPMGYPQIESYNVHVSPSEDINVLTYPAGSEERYLGIDVVIGQHYDDLSLTAVNNVLVAVSRDDVIIMTYIFWSANVYPGENCFSHCELSNFRVSSTAYIQYYLP